MRELVLCSMVSTLVAAAASCADVESDENPSSKAIHVACVDTAIGTGRTLHGWELSVVPLDGNPIQRGEPFDVVLAGTVVISRAVLEQWASTHDLAEAQIQDLHATVRVRAGATGDPITLRPQGPHHCLAGRTECSPENDGEPDNTGQRGNTGCGDEPTTNNPCGAFIGLPTSDDCSPGGVCERLGQTGDGSLCATKGYCIADDLDVHLQPELARYVADPEATAVLFGWDDDEQGTGATKEPAAEGGEFWVHPNANFFSPAGTMAVRINLSAEFPKDPVALECTMGVDSQDPSGSGPFISRASPTTEEFLLALPVAR